MRFDPGGEAGHVEDVATGQAANLNLLSFFVSRFFSSTLVLYLILTSTVAAGRRDSKQMLGTHLSFKQNVVMMMVVVVVVVMMVVGMMLIDIDSRVCSVYNCIYSEVKNIWYRKWTFHG